MKERAITKMKKAGKIGRIICNVILTVGIIASVVMLLGGIVLRTIPKDLFSMNMSTDSTVVVNIDEVEKFSKTSISHDELMEKLGLATNNLTINNLQNKAKSVEVDGNSIIVNSTTDTVETINVRTISYILFLLAGWLLVAMVMIMLVKAIFKAIEKCESPFEDNVIKKISFFAYALIPWVLLESLANGLITSLTTAGKNVVIELNMGTVIEIIVTLGLAYIFKYGAMLQKESDETL